MSPHAPVGMALATTIFGCGPGGGHFAARMIHGSALPFAMKLPTALTFEMSELHAEIREDSFV
jgi:hypothetical protein